MKNQNWTFLLVAIMGAIAFLVTGSTIVVLYNTAINQQKTRLVEIAQSQAKLIEAVARFDAAHEKTYPGTHPEGPSAATISQVIDAHKNYAGFGKTGEFTLSKKEGNYIIFILSHRHFDLDQPKPVPLNSNLAEPMRLALSGKSGTLIGLDYRGETVLAAFEPVEVLNLGIVAKIDLSEIRSPFIKAGLIAILISILAIIIGIALFLRITNPVLKKIQKDVQVQAVLNKELNKEIETRKMIEEDLRKNQHFLQKAQEIGQIGTWELDIKTNKLLWTDENYRIFGIPIGTELTYEIFLNCVHPDDREYVDKQWRGSFNKKSYDIEHRLLVDRKVKWVREKAELEFNKKDECIRGTGFTQDITERKRTEEQYRTILKTSIDGFCITDAHGCFIEVNDAYCALIGYSHDELLNMSVSDIEALEKPEDTARHIRTIMERGYDRFETQHRSRDGKNIDIEVSTAFLPDIGGRLFAFFRDITERKNSEAVLQKVHEELEHRVQERTYELFKTNEDLLKEHNQRVLLSKNLIDHLEKDRQKIAMELHDHIGQNLTSLKMSLEMIPGKLKPDQRELKTQIIAAKEKTIKVIQDVKDVSHWLWPATIDVLGVVSSLRELFSEIQQLTDIKIHFFNQEIPERFEKKRNWPSIGLLRKH